MTREIHIPFVLTVLLSAVAGGRSFASEPVAAVPPLTGIEAELLADAANGVWDRFTFVEASLIAEGMQSTQEMRALVDRFAVWKAELRGQVADTDGTHCVALEVLDLLHRRVLTGQYAAECNELSRTVEQGDFNCITATIAYLELGRSVGLRLTAVQAPGHVRVRLVGDMALDIEATCPTWQRSFAAAAGIGDRAGGSAEQEIAGKTRPLSDVALVGKLYYNRGVRLLEERRFPQAVAAARAALAFDPADEDARNNLLAAYNNWALAFCEARRYEDAVSLLVFARGIGPDFAPLASNDLHIHQKWVLDLCEQNRFSEALGVLELGHRRRPDAALFDEGRTAVRRWWAQSETTVNASTVEMD